MPFESNCEGRDVVIEKHLFSSENRYLFANFLTSFGTGLLLTVQAVFITRLLGISPVVFGLVLSGAAVLGLVAGVALGTWSDGRSLRKLMPLFGVVQAIAVAGYLVSFSAYILALVVAVSVVAARGGAAVRGPFMAALVGRDRLVTYRAKVRSVANAAMACGAALGGVMLGMNSMRATIGAMAAVPVSYLLGAALTATVHLPFAHVRTPRTAMSKASPKAKCSRPVSRNPRFLSVVAVNAVLMAHVPLLGVAFPLWISERTSAPTYLISAVVLINTIGVVLIQVPLSSFVKTPRAASLACLGAGIALAASSLVLAYSIIWTGVLQMIAILIAGLLHLVGEVWHSAASWELAFELAPRDRLGEYQGAFNSGMDMSQMIGPALFGVLVTSPSMMGWWVLASALIASGMLMGTTVSRALPYGRSPE